MGADILSKSLAQNAPISIYITNLGKYNEGRLVGKWIDLPIEAQDFQKVLREIGIDGRRYEEYFITDYESKVDGIRIGEYESIDELNYLAAMIEEIPTHEMDKFSAAVELDEYSGSIQDLINLTQNLDCYDFAPHIKTKTELGEYLIYDLGGHNLSEIPRVFVEYFDYESYGDDEAANMVCAFTDNGFISNNGDSFMIEYNGKDVPEEYVVTHVPKAERGPQLPTHNTPQHVR